MAVTLPTTLEGLRQLIEEANAAYFALEEQERQETIQERAAIVDAIGTLEALLGPAESAPGTGSIRAILAYGPETIQQNASAAVPLIMIGLEQITQTLLSIAKVVQANQTN